jgi:ABC-2 type transport system permease protein
MVGRRLYYLPGRLAGWRKNLCGGGRVNYFRLLAAYFWVGIAGEVAYRVNFFFQMVQSVISLGMSITGLSIVFTYTSTLGGWRQEDILALVGVYILVGGIIGVVIQPGMEELIESGHDGTLDFTLTKPADAQMLVSVRGINIWSLIDIVLGLGVLIYALVRLGQRVGGGEALEFTLMLAAGIVIIYSFFLVLATLSFWFVRVENFLTIFQSMYEAGRWPVSLYPGWLRYGLTFVVPVAFATTVPVEALTGRLTWVTLLIAIAIAILLFALSRWFWRIGLRHYSGASA